MKRESPCAGVISFDAKFNYNLCQTTAITVTTTDAATAVITPYRAILMFNILHYINIIFIILRASRNISARRIVRRSGAVQANVFFCFQQFGPILDVEIIFNERGSKVSSRCPIANHPCQPKKIRQTIQIAVVS